MIVIELFQSIIYEGGFLETLQMGGGRDIVLHRARTDSDFDILAMKPLRKCDGGISTIIRAREV